MKKIGIINANQGKNIKGYRFISAKQSIASYMVGFETNRMTYAEFNNWSSYLEKVLSTKGYKAIVFYGKRYLDELKREDEGFLFNIGDYSITLAEGKSIHHLDKHILSYVEVDVLLEMLEAPNGYKKLKENKEYTL